MLSEFNVPSRLNALPINQRPARLSIVVTLALGTVIMAPGLAAADVCETEQHWSFTGGSMDVNTGYNNTNGTPRAHSSGTGLESYVSQGIDKKMGVISLTGNQAVQFNIPNFDKDDSTKEVSIWIDYIEEPNNNGPYQPDVGVVDPNNNDPFSGFELSSSTLTMADGGWKTLNMVFNYDRCPSFETITISAPAGGTIYMDFVSIFTYCNPVPAPGSVALLGLGGLVAFRRRRC